MPPVADKDHNHQDVERNGFGWDDFVGIAISIAFLGGVYWLLKSEPVVLAVWGLLVSVLIFILIFYALLDYPLVLILLILILLGILLYFFTRGVLGIMFLISGILFLYGRPYWVGLVLAIAGAIILLHKSC